MRSEDEIRKMLLWYKSEYHDIGLGKIPAENRIAALKYYLGAISALTYVLQEDNQ